MLERVVSMVVGFVEEPQCGLNLPLDIRGTVLQQRVWQALQQIPVGSTATYREIASRIGRPASVRAVGQACGANPLAVAIPCHRVVRQDGDMAGYRWGVERKRVLLAREAGCSGQASGSCSPPADQLAGGAGADPLVGRAGHCRAPTELFSLISAPSFLFDFRWAGF